MSWFKKNPPQEKYVEAALTVASNLFLMTIPEAENAPSHLEFGLNDSRFRYFLFCLSTAFTTALAYDEKKKIQPSALFEGCVRAAKIVANQFPEMYFADADNIGESLESTWHHFGEFIKEWSVWPSLELAGRDSELQSLICRMIHATESDEDITDADTRRLGNLALEIDCRLPAMHGAFIDLAHR